MKLPLFINDTLSSRCLNLILNRVHQDSLKLILLLLSNLIHDENSDEPKFFLTELVILERRIKQNSEGLKNNWSLILPQVFSNFDGE